MMSDYLNYFERQKPPSPACIKCGATHRMVSKENDLCHMCESKIIGEQLAEGLAAGLKLGMSKLQP